MECPKTDRKLARMDHDLSYRDLFAFVRMMELAAKLDLASLARVENVFVSDSGRRRATDVVWRARPKADPNVWVLIPFDF